MTISPCAMLMTPMTPNVMASPIAASSSTEPSDRPYQMFWTCCDRCQPLLDRLRWPPRGRLSTAGVLDQISDVRRALRSPPDRRCSRSRCDGRELIWLPGPRPSARMRAARVVCEAPSTPLASVSVCDQFFKRRAARSRLARASLLRPPRYADRASFARSRKVPSAALIALRTRLLTRTPSSAIRLRRKCAHRDHSRSTCRPPVDAVVPVFATSRPAGRKGQLRTLPACSAPDPATARRRRECWNRSRTQTAAGRPSAAQFGRRAAPVPGRPCAAARPERRSRTQKPGHVASREAEPARRRPAVSAMKLRTDCVARGAITFTTLPAAGRPGAGQGRSRHDLPR